MEKKRILIVTQEMKPYLIQSEIAKVTRELPQYVQENGMEIRILMPRFGDINERRHRLHEVVRLSGINISVDEDDYPLIIKVASLPGARMQVYFLDNEELFKRKGIFHDDKNKFFEDNDERMIFFCKGVLETVKKFGWSPDIIHCHGWMTSLVPFYLKTAYKDDPIFRNSKVVYSVYDSTFKEKLKDTFHQKANANNALPEDMQEYFKSTDNVGLTIGASTLADAIIIASDKLDDKVNTLLSKKNGKPILGYTEYRGNEENEGSALEACQNFYNSLLQEA